MIETDEQKLARSGWVERIVEGRTVYFSHNELYMIVGFNGKWVLSIPDHNIVFETVDGAIDFARDCRIPAECFGGPADGQVVWLTSDDEWYSVPSAIDGRRHTYDRFDGVILWYRGVDTDSQAR